MKQKQILYRTMILDIHRKKSENVIPGNTPEEQYEYYVKHFLYNPVYMQSLFAEFPELERLLQQSVVQQKEMEYLQSVLGDFRDRMKKKIGNLI